MSDMEQRTYNITNLNEAQVNLLMEVLVDGYNESFRNYVKEEQQADFNKARDCDTLHWVICVQHQRQNDAYEDSLSVTPA